MINSWVFQANPDTYLVDEALRTFDQHTWLTQQHRAEIRTGDSVLIWKCGPNAALVGIGTVLTDPAFIETNENERKFEKEPLKFDGKRWRVRVKTKALNVPLTKQRLLKIPELKSWTLLKGLQGTNFRLSDEIEAIVQSMLKTQAGSSES